ncbi:MAG: M23 family metallopeptidase [Chloroflexota bacterium]|nr:M23 family metallopeptidase [Chloroflexota bacterium]
MHFLRSRFAVALLALCALLIIAPLPAQAGEDDDARLHLPLIVAPADDAHSAAGLEATLLAALERLAASDPAAFGGMALSPVRVSGAFAVAFAQTQIGPHPTEAVLLAAYAEPVGWRVLATSADPASRFNAALDAMPAALLDEGDKAFLHRPDPEQAAANVAAYAGHYLSWPGAQIAYLMQKDGGGHESQVDFDILGNAASGAVYASKPGVVVFAKQSSAGGCPSMACWQQANMVVVRHDTGEYSWYVHLAPGSVPVRVGDRVGYGTKIGVEGETGFARGVHLHYMVSTGHTTWTPPEDPNSAPWALDIRRVDFHEAAWDQLTVGQRYTSQNGMGGPCPGPLPEANQVALYEHAGYCGLYTLLNAGPYANPAALAFPNDAASSIRVGRDAAAVLCRDGNFGGVCETFTADVADLTGSAVGNDQVSSARVLPRGQVAPPAAPALRQPAAGALITGTSVALVWSEPANAAAYALQIASAPDFAAPAATMDTDGAAASIDTLPEGAYYWRVRGRNVAGLWGEWSAPGFFVRDAAPYYGPHLDLPAYNALRNTPEIRFSWLDSEADAAYRLQVFTGDSTGPVPDGQSPPGALVVDVQTGERSHTPAPLADGSYVWRVCRLQADKPAPSCSELRRLDIDTTPPQPPVPAYADGVTLTERTRAFAWLSAAGAVEYHLQVFVGEGLQAGSIAAPQTLAPFIDIRTGETAYTPAALPDGVYGWRVRAGDAAGNWSAWSEPRTVRMVAPTSWETYLPALSGG